MLSNQSVYKLHKCDFEIRLVLKLGLLFLEAEEKPQLKIVEAGVGPQAYE